MRGNNEDRANNTKGFAEMKDAWKRSSSMNQILINDSSANDIGGQEMDDDTDLAAWQLD